MSKRVIVLLLAALALVLVAGCGSSDDEADTDSATVTITKEQLIKQGDAICAKSEDRSEAEAEEFAEEHDFDLEKASEGELEKAVAAVLVPTLEQQAEEIDALGAPEGDEEKVEAIIVALEDGTAEIEDDPSLAFEDKPLKEASQLAKDYGFEVCGEE